jgi:hypothetical protein
LLKKLGAYGGHRILLGVVVIRDLPIPEYPETSTNSKPAAGYDSVEGAEWGGVRQASAGEQMEFLSA